MTKRIDGPFGTVIVLEGEADKKCELCGKVEECRPYGPNGEQICYDCAKKDEVGTEMKMNEKLFGTPITREQAEKIIARRKRMLN